MVINAQTGVVAWSYPIAGVYKITIRATNQMGSRTAFFTLTVTGSYSCIASTP
jgi:hypothetical protein